MKTLGTLINEIWISITQNYRFSSFLKIMGKRELTLLTILCLVFAFASSCEASRDDRIRSVPSRYIFFGSSTLCNENPVLVGGLFHFICSGTDKDTDCIDFYKQPAFDNPLLKNHTPQVTSAASFLYFLMHDSGLEIILRFSSFIAENA